MRPTHTPLLALALVLASVATAPAGVILSSNPGGDSFANSGSPPTNQGQPVSGGWFYNNVRVGGTVGIDGSYPRSGTGSVGFASTSSGGKADIEFLAGGTNFGGNYFATASLGSFASFSAASYEWYRDGGSTTTNVFHPALRVLLDLDGNPLTNDRASLIYEGAYNGQPVASTDAWTAALIGATTNLWSTGALGFATGGYNVTLAQWQANPLLANAVVVGFSSGIGSGWTGTFDGAVDNISWTLSGTTTTTNFEVRQAAPIPEPATLTVFGAVAAVGLARLRRRLAV